MLVLLSVCFGSLPFPPPSWIRFGSARDCRYAPPIAAGLPPVIFRPPPALSLLCLLIVIVSSQKSLSSSLQNSHCGNFVSSNPSHIHFAYTYSVVLVGHFLIKVSSIPTVGIVPLSPSASQSLYRQNSLHCQVIASPQISCVPSHEFPQWEFMTWNLLDIGYPSRIF